MPDDKLEALLAESGDSENPGHERIREIIDSVKTIAVVGMSRNPEKEARRVPAYLASRGYEIIPVNPGADRILGKPARASLADVEEAVDEVLIFRPSGEAGEHVEEAAARPEAPVIWLQEGIRADDAAGAARAGGRTVVQDLCMYKAHRAIHGDDE